MNTIKSSLPKGHLLFRLAAVNGSNIALELDLAGGLLNHTKKTVAD